MLERFTNHEYLNCELTVDYAATLDGGRFGLFNPKTRRVTLSLENPAIASAAKRNDDATIKHCVALVLASFSLEDSTEWHEVSSYNHIDFETFAEFVVGLSASELEIIRSPLPKPKPVYAPQIEGEDIPI